MKQLFFVIVVCTTSFVWVSCSHGEAKAPEKKVTAVSGALYTVKQQPLQTLLRLPAQLNPFEVVSIYPRITGYVKSVPVDIGTEVKQGQTLMELDAPDIEQNEVGAHERYIKALSAYSLSRDSYQRLLKTAQTKGAVSPNDLQSAASRMQSDSAMVNSEKAGWIAMESMKNYLVVKAPFDGTITQRNIDPGALVVVGTKNDLRPMLELQQIKKLRLQVNVPESYATQLQKDQKINFTIEALPGQLFEGTISRKANSLDQKFRSEMVEIDVANADNVLMAGMYAEVILPLSGHANASAVPQSAVVTSTERKYVIRVKDHKAQLVNVITGNENNGMIEVFGDVKAGDDILAKANDGIREGQTVN